MVSPWRFWRACKEWVGDTCFQVVKAFWRDGILTANALCGVIRLISKGGDGDFLKNWRPITMLTLIYKIINKLISLRIQLVLPKLVAKEQTGFIKGHRILDNILSLKIGKEHVKFKKFLALLLKLDFMKAYDRLDQWFLQEVLQILGFNEHFIV